MEKWGAMYCGVTERTPRAKVTRAYWHIWGIDWYQIEWSLFRARL